VNNNEAAFITHTTWMDVPRDDKGFMDFLGEVMNVLDAPEAPQPADGCALCSYRESMAAFEPDKGPSQLFMDL